MVEDLETDFRGRLQSTLTGAYRVERELGGGGMSRVFLAEERALSRRVVVKVLAPDLAAGVNFERFKQEILLTAQLQHPHILPVFTTGETEGLPYYTMPFVEGESLRVHLMRTGAMPIGAVVSILRDVARALEFAHAKSVVHRDIKPDNILLAGNTATVSDFGIAKTHWPCWSKSACRKIRMIGPAARARSSKCSTTSRRRRRAVQDRLSTRKCRPSPCSRSSS
jgi:serine/threonine-protein kinase